MNTDIFNEIERLILSSDVDEKVSGTLNLKERVKTHLTANLDDASPKSAAQRKILDIPVPGYPDTLNLVAPRELKKRGIQSQTGRNTLMHAVAHIEFNAINLALDAAYRFPNQPLQYYQDWINIAADEARHFTLINDYLNSHDCNYANLPAHNGLWEMAVKTAHDLVARMALVPRVLEARGLDVTPAIIEKLQRVGDADAVAILEVIYQDEIGHVEKGSYWFFYQCELRGLEPKSTFLKMVERHLHGELRGPFNISARLLAGFDESELHHLSKRY